MISPVQFEVSSLILERKQLFFRSFRTFLLAKTSHSNSVDLFLSRSRLLCLLFLSLNFFTVSHASSSTCEHTRRWHSDSRPDTVSDHPLPAYADWLIFVCKFAAEHHKYVLVDTRCPQLDTPPCYAKQRWRRNEHVHHRHRIHHCCRSVIAVPVVSSHCPTDHPRERHSSSAPRQSCSLVCPNRWDWDLRIWVEERWWTESDSIEHLQKSSIRSGASRIRSGVELIYRSFDVMVKASIWRAKSLGSKLELHEKDKRAWGRDQYPSVVVWEFWHRSCKFDDSVAWSVPAVPVFSSTMSIESVDCFVYVHDVAVDVWVAVVQVIRSDHDWTMADVHSSAEFDKQGYRAHNHNRDRFDAEWI